MSFFGTHYAAEHVKREFADTLAELARYEVSFNRSIEKYIRRGLLKWAFKVGAIHRGYMEWRTNPQGKQNWKMNNNRARRAELYGTYIEINHTMYRIEYAIGRGFTYRSQYAEYYVASYFDIFTLVAHTEGYLTDDKSGTYLRVSDLMLEGLRQATRDSLTRIPLAVASFFLTKDALSRMTCGAILLRASNIRVMDLPESDEARMNLFETAYLILLLDGMARRMLQHANRTT